MIYRSFIEFSKKKKYIFITLPLLSLKINNTLIYLYNNIRLFFSSYNILRFQIKFFKIILLFNILQNQFATAI